MINNPLAGKAQSLILSKLSAFKEYENNVHRIQEKQILLEKDLLAQAPETLRKFLAEGWLSSTLNYGRFQGTASLADCGCKSYEEAREKFGKLKTAWAGVVKIHFPTKRDFRIDGKLALTFLIDVIQICLSLS